MVKIETDVLQRISDLKREHIDVVEEIHCLSQENKECLRQFERDFINRDVGLDGTIYKVNGVLRSVYFDLGDFEIYCKANQVEEMLYDMEEVCPEVVQTIRDSLI